ncbi:Membrane transport protein MerF [Gracilibacillus orientalis]|uniref:Membrane transport protein MerF n=1 Tax=Gracilibacillus orientalis TaxID=334253 RepID=A0A1I4K0N2_9BACI|nr:mercury resistance system transport protein MerF [Gracilibacillus orientalis]SFL72345.1 Membrane transport protein MerF [Gracilibacillus orientalis]
MKDNKLFATGISAFSLCVLCCIAPFLAISLGGIGLGFLTGYYITIPVFAALIGVIFYKLKKDKKAKSLCTTGKCSSS